MLICAATGNAGKLKEIRRILLPVQPASRQPDPDVQCQKIKP